MTVPSGRAGRLGAEIRILQPPRAPAGQAAPRARAAPAPSRACMQGRDASRRPAGIRARSPRLPARASPPAARAAAAAGA